MERISDYLFHKASKCRIPLSGVFELSPVCNFSCKMCYVRKTPSQIREEGKHIKHWREWIKLAEECKKAGMLYLLLTGGEPFLYPGFQELYKQLHKMGFIISINTNGTMIDDEILEWLKKTAPARMNITLYGASPETYRKVCGNADGYQKAVSAILKIKEAGISVVINASMIPENSEDLEKIALFGREHGINTRISTYMFPPVRREGQEDDSRFSAQTAAEMYLRKTKIQTGMEGYSDGLRHILEKISGEKENGWGTDVEYMKCRAGRSSFWVSWEGSMSACGMMPFPIQVYPFETPFQECWEELTTKVRIVPVLKGCGNCSKKELCKPCVAMIHAETGETNCKAPYLCEMAEWVAKKMEEQLREEVEHG